VLLSKVDKLNQAERRAGLRSANAALGGLATVQLFSAHAAIGVREAQQRLTELWNLMG
jgi:GTP-binding protein EngB required for normal cell division